MCPCHIDIFYKYILFCISSLQVPLIIKPVTEYSTAIREYNGLVELVDIFPTAVSLAGIQGDVIHHFNLSGTDLTKYFREENSEISPKKYAFSQITRCYNCTRAYHNTAIHPDYQDSCVYDESVDVNFTVPCAKTTRNKIDFMGLSLRSLDGWRYSIFCKWIGALNFANFSECHAPELYDFRNQTKKFDPEGESKNLAGGAEFVELENFFRSILDSKFGKSNQFSVKNKVL